MGKCVDCGRDDITYRTMAGDLCFACIEKRRAKMHTGKLEEDRSQIRGKRER